MIQIIPPRSLFHRVIRWSSIGLAIILLFAQPAHRVGRFGTEFTFIAPAYPVASASLAALPLAFTPNWGQSEPGVQYQAHSLGGSALYFSRDGVRLVLPATTAYHGELLPARDRALVEPDLVEQAAQAMVLHLSFMGANTAPAMAGEGRLPGSVNYFLGNDPDDWVTSLPTYAQVIYRDLYPGIDLIYEGPAAGDALLKGTYRVAPGADPSLIRWRYEGAASLNLDKAGNLHIDAASRYASGEQAGDVSSERVEARLIEQAPIAWQETGGRREFVLARYELAADGSIGFTFPEGYDPSRPLVLDPTLAYSTYLGGTGEDVGYSIAADATGIYVVGYTRSTDFPIDGAIDPDCGTDGFCNSGLADVFVTKLNPSGSATIYSTYLGGSGNDYGVSIAIDAAGNAYVSGIARADFPTTPNAYQRTFGAGVGADAFLAKLNASGSALLYSSYLGGNNGDGAWGLSVDASDGNAYLSGQTYSSNFPTTPTGYDTACGTDGACNYDGASTYYSDAFVVQMNTTISGTASLSYSTFLGGSSEDQGFGLARDASGEVYQTGRTASADLPIGATPFQGSLVGNYDAFVAKIDPALSGNASFIYATYLGGTGYDDGYGISVDGSGNVVLHGSTTSSFDFPLEAPLQGVYGGGPYDAYLAKLNASGSALVYATYLGGVGDDEGYGIAADATGNVYITGFTDSSNFPTANAFQPWKSGAWDAYLMQVNAFGSALVFSTYLGGFNSDAGFGIFRDSVTGSLFLSGQTFSSTSFPTINPYQANHSGNSDVIVARIDMTLESADLSIVKTDTPDPVLAGKDMSYTITVANLGPATASGVRIFDRLYEDVTFISATPSQGSGCTVSPLGYEVSCKLGDINSGSSVTITLVINVPAWVAGTITNTASVMANLPDSDAANNLTIQTTTVNPYGIYLPILQR